MEKDPSVNVLGEPLKACSTDPVTGFFRDGACNTCREDNGSHTVCAVMTAEFLAYSKYVGNDLSTPRPEYLFPGLKPGDMNKMFERIVATAPGNRTLTDAEREELKASGMTEYSVIVHSRPSDGPVTDVSLKTDKELPPWIITFENFITDEECDAMIQHGHIEGYKRSEDVGKTEFDGSVGSVQSKGRTSENAWCGFRSGCREEEVPKRLHERIFNVTGIPPANSEDFQILRYEIGQFYNTHHDFIPHQGMSSEAQHF